MAVSFTHLPKPHPAHRPPPRYQAVKYQIMITCYTPTNTCTRQKTRLASSVGSYLHVTHLYLTALTCDAAPCASSQREAQGWRHTSASLPWSPVG
ncbi:hypothetical protein E2C01_039988 [Portunus trituberculatus]|uniref:Uncharacterized protein n=1 Tax=Portunus trituberculatus TaxID=210409 RepID=A0A5B7FPH9_PORTR|nr:hypothetical protein [Portunus trituberculatus]